MRKLMIFLISAILMGCASKPDLTAQVSRPYSGDIESSEKCLLLAEKPKNACLQKLAEKTSDPSYCSQIAASTLRLKCLERVR
ncbi:MAG: hypothetical protein P1V18_00355 [Candidatus Gracilibacteria bacterium]|nr:hypothetical protein [Candidatus Gracilibacteria bacterium]